MQRYPPAHGRVARIPESEWVQIYFRSMSWLESVMEDALSAIRSRSSFTSSVSRSFRTGVEVKTPMGGAAVHGKDVFRHDRFYV